MPELEVRLVDTEEEARRLCAAGFEPIECSFGGRSVMGPFQMDHHGEWSHLEGVALRAYRDHFGVRREDPRFVVTHVDADNTFAIASLAGILPHPSREQETANLPPNSRALLLRDLMILAELVNQKDLNPIGLDLTTGEGQRLLTWDRLQSCGRAPGSLEAYFGVGLWEHVINMFPLVIQAVVDNESTRLQRARRLGETGTRVSDEVLVITGSDVWGFDVWYNVAPVVVVQKAQGSGITVGVHPDRATELLGPLGLTTVFEALGEGWGGRGTVGGSPRGDKFTEAETISLGRRVAELVKP